MIAAPRRSRESEILEQARQALDDRLSSFRPHLTCEFREGLLLIRGRVSSYYHKQVAQEAVLRLQAVERVVNQIEVVPV